MLTFISLCKVYSMSCSSLKDTWVWTDGTPWDYTDWASGQPDDYNKGEDCLELRKIDEQFNDDKCYHLLTFVCKI